MEGRKRGGWEGERGMEGRRWGKGEAIVRVSGTRGFKGRRGRRDRRPWPIRERGMTRAIAIERGFGGFG